MCVCTCVYIYIYIYTRTRTHIYIYIYICVAITCVHIYIYIYTYIYIYRERERDRERERGQLCATDPSAKGGTLNVCKARCKLPQKTLVHCQFVSAIGTVRSLVSCLNDRKPILKASMCSNPPPCQRPRERTEP